MNRLMITRIFVVTLFMGLSSCTLWYGLNQDPDGIPCSDDAPFCLDGYTCVDDGNARVCRQAAILGIGQRCNADAECAEDAACADVYGDDCGDDINCALGAGDGKRCRQKCDLSLPVGDECAPGDICWPDGLRGGGFCQSGTCTADIDCGSNVNNNLSNLCINQINGPESGTCSSGCDPFECNSALETCGGCPLIDADGDGISETWGCEPIDTAVLGRFGCVVAGSAPAFAGCGGGVFCQPGSFCTNILDGSNAGFCTQYCNPQGGAPACNQGACQNIDGRVGFCQ